MDINFWINHADSLFHQIFMIVMGGLMGIAHLFGTTYNVINIVVYFFFIPASWIYLLSRKTTKWLNLISVFVIGIFSVLPNKRESSNYIFEQSVIFLNYTASIFNSNYIDMSVYICVVVVAIVYIVLFYFTIPKRILKIISFSSWTVCVLYMLIIFPRFKDFLLYLLETYNVKY